MTGQHRDILAPWMYRLRCWAFGHDIEQTGHRMWHCTRCDRCAATPVQLP